MAEAFPSAVFLAWLFNEIESNVELATLSNVCQSWRKVITKFLLDSSVMQGDCNGVCRTSSSTDRLLLPSMIRRMKDPSQSNASTTPDDDSFCAAWFHPLGIETTLVPIQPLLVTAQDEDRERPNNCRRARTPPLRRGVADAAVTFECCYEWKGYREAWDVLQPFGYSKIFLDNVLSQVIAIGALGMVEAAAEATGPNTDKRSATTTTAAVRGATYARPESYCACWDQQPLVNGSRPFESVTRLQRRTMRQRQHLPRTILSSPFKGINQSGNRQRAVQFLNASRGNAIRMLTTPFDCGLLTGPITIFIVGIATEDGCFCSGLKTRCEVGHLYPRCGRDDMTNLSSVCIATSDPNHDERRIMTPDSLQDDNDDDDDDSDGDYQNDESDEDDDDVLISPACSSDDQSFKCKCTFNTSQGDFRDVVIDSTPPDMVHHGQMGPGAWHVYSLVVDGQAGTYIRVDGNAQQMQTVGKKQQQGVALDGLTIGSDHWFDMSLCFGEGGPAEGEGAISELCCFKGSLPLQDVKSLEQHLMKKHGISPVGPGQELFVLQEDDWKRTCRAFYEQPPPYDKVVVPEGVPLRVLAGDDSVSWHRNSNVTGDKISVGRIGSRLSNGSSDW